MSPAPAIALLPQGAGGRLLVAAVKRRQTLTLVGFSGIRGILAAKLACVVHISRI